MIANNTTMNKLFLLLTISSIVFASCAQTGKNDKAAKEEKIKIEITADKLDVKIDPVCQMTKFEVADTMTYQGKLYGFCNPGCKNEFKAEPEKFLSALPKD